MEYKKRIIVTGGAGFIGSNYLNKCVIQHPDYFFVNVDCLTYAGDLKNLKISKEKNYSFEKADIRDVSAIEKIFKKHSPTDIIHFAAESHVDASIKNPSIFVETNIVGTHNLLQLAKQNGLKRFYQVSTDEVYGSLGMNDAPFTTSSPMAPNSPYSASKAAADMLARSYNRTFGLDTVISRCSNNYGPNQDESKLIPKAITNIKAGKKVPVYGRGENVRDWLYVEDHVDAIDAIFHKGKAGDVYNIGGGCEMSNNQIVQELIEALGKGDSPKSCKASIEYVTDRPGHDFRYAIDATELEKMLGWKAKVSFKDGIKKALEHYV